MAQNPSTRSTAIARSRSPVNYIMGPSSDELEEGMALLVKEDRQVEEEINEHRLGVFFWILLIVGFSGFVAFFGWDREIVQVITRYFGSREGTTTTDLYIQASNSYGSFTAPYAWLDSTPGSQIVEPYTLTTLTVSGAFSQGSSYIWTLDYPSSSDPTTWTGSQTSQELTLESTGTFSISIEAFDSKTGSFRGRYTTLLISKYVKREIRTLTQSDRTKLWTAAAFLWNTSTSEGQVRFGSDFTSIATFANAYMANTSPYRCDSYHDGSAWITHHLALSNAFEASLRAVDPSVSLPYWDFTIEGQAITDADETPSYFLEISPLFTTDYLGVTNTSTSSVSDSIWASVIVPGTEASGAYSSSSVSESIFDDLQGAKTNAYGYLRSHWNVNSASTITRHLFDTCGVEITDKAIPDCSVHYELLNTAMLETFQLLSPSASQSALHNHLGGVFGDCTSAYANFSDAWSSLLDADMTTSELAELGYKLSDADDDDDDDDDATDDGTSSSTELKDWYWGLTAPRRAMLESVVMGEYHHIYRGLWRSHICSRDGTPRLLECPSSGACASGGRRRRLDGKHSERSLRNHEDDDNDNDNNSNTNKDDDDDQGGTTSTTDACTCSIPGITSDGYDWENVYYCVVDEDNRDDFAAAMPEQFRKELTILLANTPILEGDVIDTAGLSDMSFWLMLPTVERLLVAKRLQGLTEFASADFAKWDSYDGSNETWLSYSLYSLAAGENDFYPSAYTCAGHAASDPVLDTQALPLQGGVALYDADGDGAVSNWEYFLACDPNRLDPLPYVFADLSWDHCRGKL